MPRLKIDSFDDFGDFEKELDNLNRELKLPKLSELTEIKPDNSGLDEWEDPFKDFE